MSNKANTPKAKASSKANTPKAKASSKATPTTTEYQCTLCKLVFDSPKEENVKCPTCKSMAKIRLHPDHERYVRGLGDTASGRPTYDIGDQVAMFLRGLTPEDVMDVVADYLDMLSVRLAFSPKMRRQRIQWAGTTAEWLAAKYEGRNEGMIRMNCGNILRGALNRAETAN